MALPILPLNVKNSVVITSKVVNDNEITLPVAGKYVFDFTASSEVQINVYGPFPGGVVDATKKAGLGKLSLKGTNVAVGNTLAAAGSYLVEFNASTTSTVSLTVRPFGGLDFLYQYYWKLFRKQS